MWPEDEELMYEEGEEYDPYTYEALMAMLAPLPIQQGTAKWNFGADMPYSIDTYAKQGNALQDDLDIMADPSLALLGASMGFNTVDYGQFVPQAPQVPEPVMWTPTYDSLAQSPNYKAIAGGIDAGATLPEINATIRGMDLDDDTKADLLSTASQAYKEVQDAQRSQREYETAVATTPGRQTPMQQMAAKAGLPDPLAYFGDENNPLEVESGEARRSDLLAEAARRELSTLEGYANRGAQRGERNLDEDYTAFMTQPRDVGRPAVAGGGDVAESIPSVGRGAVRASGLDAFNALGGADPVGRGSVRPAAAAPRGATKGSAFAGASTSSRDAADLMMQAARGAVKPGGFTPLDADFSNPAYIQEMDRRGAAVPQQVRKRATGRKPTPTRRDVDRQRRIADGHQNMAQAKRSEASRIASQMMREKGDTPFNRAIADRMAMMQMLRGG